MRTFAISLAVLALAGGTLAQAQAVKIGVINIQSALASTKDGQKAAGELEAKTQPKRRAIEAKQNEINGMKDQLQKGQNALSDAAKAELVRNIDSKTKSLTRDTEDAQAEVEQDTQKVLQELGGRLMAVLDKFAKDNQYTLILDVSSPQSPILFASTATEITKEIIDLYDKNSGANAARPANPGTSTPVRPAAPPAATPAKPKVPGTTK